MTVDPRLVAALRAELAGGEQTLAALAGSGFGRCRAPKERGPLLFASSESPPLSPALWGSGPVRAAAGTCRRIFERRSTVCDVFRALAVRTIGRRLAEPERLPDAEALRGFLDEHGIDTPIGRNDLQRFRALRGRLFAVLTAPTVTDLVARLNALIAEVTTGAKVVARADGGWALALTPRPRLRLDQRLTAVAAGELVDLVSTVGPERIRACSAAPCREIFVDTSRNGRRLYCSRRCANRLNATRHRHRHGPTDR